MLQGLLKETTTDSFLLVEESGSRSKGPVVTDMVCEDEEAESALASAHDQREEELQVTLTIIPSHVLCKLKSVCLMLDQGLTERNLSCSQPYNAMRWYRQLDGL